MRYKCIKKLVMHGTNEIATLPGKVYDFTKETLNQVRFTDESGSPHYFTPESMLEYFTSFDDEISFLESLLAYPNTVGEDFFRGQIYKRIKQLRS